MNDFQSIVAIIFGVGQVVTVMMSVGTAIFAWVAAHRVQSISGDLKELTLNTNSIKDALVATTDRAARAEGEAHGIEKASAAAAVVAADLITAAAAAAQPVTTA